LGLHKFQKVAIDRIMLCAC